MVSSGRARPNLQHLLLAFLILISVVGILLSGSGFARFDTTPGGGRALGPIIVPKEALVQEGVEIQDPTIVRERTNSSLWAQGRNALPPRNSELFPALARDHIIVVLYVHNRPQYLRVVIEGLSRVEGINETLLIVSHDGFYPEMAELVEKIDFCQVKQLFAAYSPHLFPSSFPGTSPGDCKNKDDPVAKKCEGQADQYGNHRSPRIVSLKHHWWWMMNTIWDGLPETRGYNRHIVFIEEDHYLFPNAYRNIQTLARITGEKCPDCWAVNLAPWDVKNRGERGDFLVAEKIGNMGYGFNRTMWNKLHSSAATFCHFDDYNWDITLWSSVYPSWDEKAYTLRGPRTSALHFGRCGLHQGHQDGKPECQDFTQERPQVDPEDRIMNIDPSWEVSRHVYNYPHKFTGWGGWGDRRDQKLCMEFASMYRHRHRL
ncbi:alpha-1,6-mannosyl-glycoprotein 2-beta-N-acetylglucosaminyltransferase-like [Selaginella moellendorffii]|uniref:alpha-1,6-mannosyl-glycoprotein 2-beta-N-acetylglucosaminyltransferase-like n=1 Tax=Selaginella moellendorffii TaxID=88036 RepID=UPI000D1C6905|nr:alpha-1,6-mannosyl-glycoprotein 2-beta-N-acetylglucosaminyltransferase-like [Selaginella moellendorffii]|eukprot:XP_024535453.1 alpha-1,6-mannosyl-glycoprotein 2-beta-N-acetylglucosaminyltransferase-like [Selaginella moellendorffii]